MPSFSPWLSSNSSRINSPQFPCTLFSLRNAEASLSASAPISRVRLITSSMAFSSEAVFLLCVSRLLSMAVRISRMVSFSGSMIAVICTVFCCESSRVRCPNISRVAFCNCSCMRFSCSLKRRLRSSPSRTICSRTNTNSFSNVCLSAASPLFSRFSASHRSCNAAKWFSMRSSRSLKSCDCRSTDSSISLRRFSISSSRTCNRVCREDIRAFVHKKTTPAPHAPPANSHKSSVISSFSLRFITKLRFFVDKTKRSLYFCDL